jgi:hypothetical protein
MSIVWRKVLSLWFTVAWFSIIWTLFFIIFVHAGSTTPFDYFEDFIRTFVSMLFNVISLPYELTNMCSNPEIDYWCLIDIIPYLMFFGALLLMETITKRWKPHIKFRFLGYSLLGILPVIHSLIKEILFSVSKPPDENLMVLSIPILFFIFDEVQRKEENWNRSLLIWILFLFPLFLLIIHFFVIH